MINKTFLKFFAGALVIVAVGIGVVYGLEYYRKTYGKEYQAKQYAKELEQLSVSDTYGGATPEETLQLFVDALKKRDIELASRYFVFEEQASARAELQKSKDNDLLGQVVIKLAGLTLQKKDDNSASLMSDGETTVIQLKRSANGKWKIF